MSQNPNVRVGFIGLGAMGMPMAMHLHGKGLLAMVANRSKANVLIMQRELGVAAANSDADFSLCNVVVLCLPYDADVLAHVGSLAKVLTPGSIVIDHSTVSVETAKQCGELLAKAKIGFIDAPVSGGVEGARNGKLSIMVGASVADLQSVQAVLQTYAARITHMGDVGSGQATKAVNQILVAGINEAVCEGLAFAEKLGLNADQLIPTLMSGAAANWFLEKRGATMLRSEFTPGFKVAHMRKDLGIVQSMAKSLGIETTCIDQALHDYSELVEHGMADADTSALIQLKRKAFD